MVSSPTKFTIALNERYFVGQMLGAYDIRMNPNSLITYVQSTHINAAVTNSGQDPDYPKLTIDAAINVCVASRGDVVVVLPGHVETIADGATIIPDVAGVTILGIGTGSARPTITFSATGSNIPVSGANMNLINFLLLGTAGVDVTSGITVTGADCRLVDIECQESGATVQFVAVITLGTGAARCRITRPIHRGHLTGDANANAITCSVALDGVYIDDPDFDGLYSNGAIYNVSVAMTNLTINGGRLRNRHASTDGGISVVATTTGWILSPRVRTATNDADGFNLAIVAAAMQIYNPLVVNLNGEIGGVWGTASAAA